MLTIIQAVSIDEVGTIRDLFREYQTLLGIDLSFQGFEAELEGLPGEYSPPYGRLLLALNDGVPVGCGALRTFHGPRCEMKRLFVPPGVRGLGVGRALVVRLMDEARSIGYTEMVLDTLPTMAEAQNLYVALGFHDIPPYRANPIPSARYLGCGLVKT